MKVKPPPDRRKFANEWDEVEYLYDKLLYWLYHRKDVETARRYAERLEELLPMADPKNEAIFGAECWSLLHEARGDFPKAIKHREREISLIRRLHDISRDSPNQHFILSNYGYDDLSDRLDLLAVLYHDSGRADKAIRTLQESKQLCNKHGIPFDGEDVLAEYLAEQDADGLTNLSRAGTKRHVVSRRLSGVGQKRT